MIVNNAININNKKHFSFQIIDKNPPHLPMEIHILAWKQTHKCGELNQLMEYIMLPIHLIILSAITYDVESAFFL